jgi:hypothetical protein
VHCKPLQIKTWGAFSLSFVIPVQAMVKNGAVDGTMLGWAGSKPHPIGIKSAFDGTEQIF